MKKLIAVLALLGLSLLALPQHAQACQDMCQGEDMSTIASLSDCVQCCYQMGHIDNVGVESSLLAILDAAQALVNRGQNAPALQILQAFISAVNAQSGVHIDPTHAQHMIMHAQTVIQALGG